MQLISTVFTGAGSGESVSHGSAWLSVVMLLVLFLAVVLLLRFAARIGSRALFPDPTAERD